MARFRRNGTCSRPRHSAPRERRTLGAATHLDPHTPHPAGFHIGEARRIKGADVRATEGIQIACHKRECRPHECTSWRVCRVGFAERGLRSLRPRPSASEVHSPLTPAALTGAAKIARWYSASIAGSSIDP